MITEQVKSSTLNIQLIYSRWQATVLSQLIKKLLFPPIYQPLLQHWQQLPSETTLLAAMYSHSQ